MRPVKDGCPASQIQSNSRPFASAVHYSAQPLDQRFDRVPSDVGWRRVSENRFEGSALTGVQMLLLSI